MSKTPSAAHKKPAAPARKRRAAALESGPAEPMARLSVDLPRAVHKRFKVACANADTSMVAEVMTFIERRTRELEKAAR